ncbi:DUF1127 domain-containing protein [Labrenzia sp. CE80]|uniref:DUF1127 domain-containing protein n=1 Tax=Labrenzia sp. CE80 TaxID=1788986 RepID=UPI00129B4D4F|nr:DUF1127 domain-containing protein [Labrenzia sp. CE80]
MTVIDADLQLRGDQGSLRSAFLAYVYRKFVLWQHMWRSRAQLSKLSDEALADIGVSRAVANGEACRPFWATSKRPY